MGASSKLGKDFNAKALYVCVLMVVIVVVNHLDSVVIHVGDSMAIQQAKMWLESPKILNRLESLNRLRDDSPLR
jgi:hypothetical protein